ncbi:MAG TPA: hypothetical protein DEG28_06320, partial [Porphyromonadaceae bacterium]|nr:hypothetical protein [Porphyromonadaceae bacterium]
MKVKKFLLFVLYCVPFFLFAQEQITVKGVVTESASGQPAIGVSVLVKGSSNGTVTDIDGNYTLTNVPDNATLVFSYIGML